MIPSFIFNIKRTNSHINEENEANYTNESQQDRQEDRPFFSTKTQLIYMYILDIPVPFPLYRIWSPGTKRFYRELSFFCSTEFGTTIE